MVILPLWLRPPDLVLTETTNDFSGTFVVISDVDVSMRKRVPVQLRQASILLDPLPTTSLGTQLLKALGAGSIEVAGEATQELPRFRGG